MTELQSREISGSLFQRTILFWLNTVISFLGRYTPKQTMQETQRRLTIAGNPYNLRVPQYYGFRVLFFIVGVVISFTIFQTNASLEYLLIALLILLVFLVAPGAWLNTMMKRRQDMIRKIG
ncbi:MAG: hypothetical protein PHQ36_04965, partial [Anaerolineales bacterium]|nr:hypothetical protein [Anaerolineales bacterium]